MVWSAGAAVGVGGAGVAPGGVVGEGGVGGAGGVGVAGDCMVVPGRVPSLPLAGAWWFVGSPAVVASVSSGGRGCWWRR